MGKGKNKCRKKVKCGRNSPTCDCGDDCIQNPDRCTCQAARACCKKVKPRDFLVDNNIEQAVNDYCDGNQAEVEATYGPIAQWDVSKVTRMSDLFISKKTFNADLSSWNTAKVTEMNAMFGFAKA